MTGDLPSAPPGEDEAPASVAERAQWEISVAERHRARGDLATAATWYRRAVEHLVATGDATRATSVAKLSEELAALDDAGRASSVGRDPARPRARIPSAGPVPPQPPSPPPFVAPRRTGAPRPSPRGRHSTSPSTAPRSATTAAALIGIPNARAPGSSTATEREATATTTTRLAETSAAFATVDRRALEIARIAPLLPALPIFAGIPPLRLASLAAQLARIEHVAGESLCVAGAPAGSMFAIVEGSAEVRLANPHANRVLLGPGDVAGESSALFGGARTVHVVALTTVVSLAVPPSLVRSLARELPAFREEIVAAAVERARAALPHLAPLYLRPRTDAAAALVSASRIVTVPEGAALLVEGEDPTALWVLAAGEVELYGGAVGVEPGVRVHPGEAFGVRAVLRGERCAVSVRALRESLVARVPVAIARDLAARFPAMRGLADDAGVPGLGVVC